MTSIRDAQVLLALASPPVAHGPHLGDIQPAPKGVFCVISIGYTWAWILLIAKTMNRTGKYTCYLLTALLLLTAASASAEKGWQTTPQRSQGWVKTADKLGMRRASQRAVTALNKAYGLKLTPDRVRIVSYSGKRKFWSFVEKTNKNTLGMVVTPHGTGPHPHLLVGDRVYDGIQPGWTHNGKKATFRDGTMMRKDSFGRQHGSERIFCLFNAPASSIKSVGGTAEKLFHLKRNQGYNCAAFVTENMKKESASSKGSPFSRISSTWSPRTAVNSVMKAQPDMIIQVVPEQDYHRIKNDPNHLVKFWQQQQF